MTRSSAFANWQKLMSIDIKSETTSPAKAVQLPDPCPRLREPLRVCYDVVSDTLYVSDYQNHAIRKFKDGEQGTLACADENGESFCGPVGKSLQFNFILCQEDGSQEFYRDTEFSLFSGLFALLRPLSGTVGLLLDPRFVSYCVLVITKTSFLSCLGELWLGAS